MWIEKERLGTCLGGMLVRGEGKLWQEMVGEVLGEEGEGEGWLRKLEELREGQGMNEYE